MQKQRGFPNAPFDSLRHCHRHHDRAWGLLWSPPAGRRVRPVEAQLAWPSSPIPRRAGAATPLSTAVAGLASMQHPARRVTCNNGCELGNFTELVAKPSAKLRIFDFLNDEPNGST